MGTSRWGQPPQTRPASGYQDTPRRASHLTSPFLQHEDPACAHIHRLVVSHEAPLTSGFGAEIVAAISDRCFYSLEAPPLRIAGYDTPFPLVCEPLYLPGVQRVVDGVRRLLRA